jgi:hypothetical protein
MRLKAFGIEVDTPVIAVVIATLYPFSNIALPIPPLTPIIIPPPYCLVTNCGSTKDVVPMPIFVPVSVSIG